MPPEDKLRDEAISISAHFGAEIASRRSQ